ncbi:PAS domain-containing protein [Luteolibacter sp. AS25]|uniref:PAS domain-containing protein n=1 Tax=Luteolibacter sp. AS25 TaxID=3135776 RepID=UPI00398AD329
MHSDDFHRAHAEILKMLVSSAPLSAVFDRIALLVEDISSVQTWCAIVRINGNYPSAKHLAAAPSIPHEFIEELRQVHVQPEDGTCGKAINERRTVSVEDIPADPEYEMFHEFSKKTGVRACWTTPIFGKDAEVIAILTAFYHEAHLGHHEEISRGDDLSSLIALAIQKYETDEEVAKSDMRFRSVASATTDAIWDWDILGDQVWWNEEFSRLFGYEGRNLGPYFDEWVCRIYPDDRDRVSQSLKAASIGKKTFWKEEYRFLRTDGSIAHVLDQARIFFNGHGKAVRMVGGMSDITDHRNTQVDLTVINRAFEMLSSCNKILIRATDEAQLLDDICHIATEIGGYRAALVAYGDNTPEKKIIPAAQVGLIRDTFTGSHFSYDENRENGRGPGAQVLRTGTAVSCHDINTIYPVPLWKDDAVRNGIKSLIFLPLKTDEKCFGYLGLGSGIQNAIGKDEEALLQELADNLAFGIISIRERVRQQLTQESIIKVAKTVSGEYGKDFYQQLTLDMVNTLGAKLGSIGKMTESGLQITTRAYVLDGEIQENITYDLYGTPCYQVTEKQACLYTDNVAELFPEDLFLGEKKIEAYAGIALCVDQKAKPVGILSVLFEKEISDPELIRSILRIFAERAASEMAREESDNRIRNQASLLDKARDAIFTCDLDHKILFWNKSSERLYGYTQNEILGKSARELLHFDTETYDIFHEGTLREGEWLGELRQICRQGNAIYVESRWNLVLDSEGKPQSILIINTDVTEHRQLQQQFLRAQRLESIGTIAGGLAHDLNNVLTPITMSAELLRKTISDPRGTELLEMITNSAARGARMISQVLSFARGIEGRKARVAVEKVIEELEPIVRDTFPKAIKFRTNIQQDLWNIIGDSTQLHQVLLNLCVNARDAMPHGGTLSINAVNLKITEEAAKNMLGINAGPHIRLRVSDDGEGIAPQIINEIFDPFFTTKETGKGTGLGLSSVLGILKSHGGIIQANSSQGQGSTFNVFLPALRESVVFAENPTDQETQVSGNGEIILIIDDEPSISNVISKTLRENGYETICASSGMEGIVIFERKLHDISLVITDIMMPGMDGTQVIRRLLAANPSIPIIGISGVTSNAISTQSPTSMVKYFLEKPFKAKCLLEAVRNAL